MNQIITIMEKRTYIQPKMEMAELSFHSSVMQLVLGSPTAPEPHTAPKRHDTGPSGVWL